MDRLDEKSNGICLLSLDGGGPGSLSQLRIIGEYLSRLAHDRGVDVDSLFLADLLDMIGGVGFGAYVALLLGPLRLPISQATEELVNLGTTLFPLGQEAPTTEENSRRLKQAIEEMLMRQKLPIDIKLKDSRLPGTHCNTVIFATPCANASHCMPFRTYSSREQSLDCTLVEAACATLAIPPHFDSVLVGPPFRGKKFSSACIGFNNITRELLKEAGKQFGQNRRVSTILSIGAGHTSTLKHTSLPNPDSYYDLLKRIATDSEKVARELSAQLFNVDAYFRLNVDYGMENIDLNNWTGLGEIESQTDVYLQGTAVDNAIDSSLRSLESKPGMITLEQLNRSTGVKVQAKTVPAVSPYFVVRKDFWNTMEHHLITSPEAKRKILVLSGMGGCGKTQMVAYFVEKYHTHYQHVFFVDASSAASIQADLQSAIRALGAGYTFEDAILFLSSSQHGGNWLLILDNADNPDLNLSRYLPMCFHGTILITTRNQGFGRLNTTAHLQLGSMSNEEAYEALVRAAHRTLPLSTEEDASAKELMAELGSLALALVQAGNYCYSMSTTRSNYDIQYTFEQYLLLFKKHRKELMTRGDTNSLDQYTRGAYTTFDLSYSLLPQSAREFLHLSGFLHHTDISLSILEYASQNNFSDWHEYLSRPKAHSIIKGRLKALLCPGGLWDELFIHGIIHHLQSFSLLSTSSISGTIFLRFHPLVHTWSRDVLAKGEEESYRRMAMQVIVSCTPPSNTILYRFLLPHMTAFLRSDLNRGMHVNDQMGLGRVLQDLGDYSEAESLFKAALATMETEIGKHHADTIRVTLWLAWACRLPGRLEEARQMNLYVLAQFQKVLGKEHADTTYAAGNLALTYYAQGRWKEAEKIFGELLEQRRRLLDEDDPDVINAAAHLALTYHKQGMYKEAGKIQVKVLAQQQRLLGNDHPNTIWATANLASTYREQGICKEAEKMFLKVLEKRQTLLNKDHPDTIRAVASLATTYRKQGRFAEAERMELEVLEKRQRQLGKGHPETIKAFANLALTYNAQGKSAEAEKIFVEVLDQRRKLLSQDHPDTIYTALNLASMYRNQEKWDDAEKMELEVLEKRRRLLTTRHPDTIVSATNLASTYFQQGKWKEAERLQMEAVEAARKVFGPEHPKTNLYVQNLSQIRDSSPQVACKAIKSLSSTNSPFQGSTLNRFFGLAWRD